MESSTPCRGIAAALGLVLAQGAAAELTRTDLDAWLASEVTVDAPAPGSVLSGSDIDRLRAFIPPGYVDEFAADGVTVTIQPTEHFVGHPAFNAATQAFAGQARLGAGGELENYTAGQPFSDAQIAQAAPDQAGLMIGWNQVNRWQYSGYQVDELSMAYLAAGGTGQAADPDIGLVGGGVVGRRLVQRFHRVYLSHVAFASDAGYRVDVPDAGKRFYKDYIEFLSPFDVAGTKFVVERSLDPHEDDQVNTYLPTERRVRRFSAKERADAFMGSDVTLDDFDGFAGRVLDYRWTLVGRRTVLDVIDAGEPLLRYGGPMSRALIDRWQLRDCYVVELHSTWEDHPYQSRLLFIDRETYDVAIALAFDRDGRLWKVFDPVYRVTRDVGGEAGATVSSWRGQANLNLREPTATMVHALTDTLHPTMKPSAVKRIFSVSSLTSGK
ncbi:MAG: DUF1329 domain-containing protein [Gammaproteobacteria bacterium]